MNVAKLFSKLSKWPLGKNIFSIIASQKAPYFASISPQIIELTETGCTLIVKKRRKVLNHIGTVHAIALCNACEMAFGFTMEAGIPRHLRWIPKGMTVRYLKKAGTDMKAVCNFPQILTITEGDHVVPVEVFDTNGQVVMDAQITVYISLRK